MIALGLAAVLLTVVFQFLLSNARFEVGLEKAQATLREQERLRERIDSLLTSIQPPLEGPSFYTLQFPEEKHLSLIASFDAGIDPDPAYSGRNTARLFIDQDNQFCITQWPLEKTSHRTEVLLQDIRAIEWEFLGHNYLKDPHAKQIAGTWCWLKSWPKNQTGLPSIVRLHLWQGVDKKKQREPNLQIAFILTNQEPLKIIKES